ncbi:uncharacterized protein G6M90_00g088970 [Metarhizium brunneum]|uniref:Uncharacterized protein n=1 Tax=Metarhizium brunneum TaxID=500148 RepID=A0A7D5V1Q7_9HYPO|nr:hypothetical protein G6M90_00g088970 [Metarhizium brunneum]
MRGSSKVQYGIANGSLVISSFPTAEKHILLQKSTLNAAPSVGSVDRQSFVGGRAPKRKCVSIGTKLTTGMRPMRRADPPFTATKWEKELSTTRSAISRHVPRWA